MTSFSLLLKCMSVFIFILIHFDHLCTNHYHTLSMVFFSPLNAYFLLSLVHVRSPIACVSHSNHFRSFFVIVDCHFVVMSPFCIGLYLIFVDCLLLFFLWVVSTCVLICLVLLMDGFPSFFFIYWVFLERYQMMARFSVFTMDRKKRA
jgi:hypothetical protein